ncbi:hypothetical protein ABMA27_008203 [Loxostege sticticalis]|uniref:Gustatory receptor n=1 Tax=Loxostege sticticalis TaxID=481309 RepID=A0ABR3HEI4_LOXSC
MRFTLFKVVPLDWALPVIILNLWSPDLFLVVYFFVFYSVYCRLKVLNRLVYISGGEHIMLNLDIYKSIADTLHVVKKYYNIIYVLIIILITPSLIFATYTGLVRFKNFGETDTYIGYLVRMIFNVERFILLSSSAVSAGLVISAVEDLKLILLDRILRERETDHEPQLQIFLDYVSSRPLRFTLFKVVPMDWSLPVLILNLCITYQIIIVQFTNIY